MDLKQNELEHLEDLLERGIITPEAANVEMVKMARVRLIENRLPAKVRKALNLAVKNKELGHLKKDGNKPEAYFHLSFTHLARSERSKRESDIKKALHSVCA